MKDVVRPVVPCCALLSAAWAKAIIARVFFGTLAVWQLLTALRLHAMCGEPAAAQK